MPRTRLASVQRRAARQGRGLDPFHTVRDIHGASRRARKRPRCNGRKSARAAMGADRRDLLTLVLVEAFRLTVAGVAAGLTASFGLTRLLKAQLFGVTPSDPLTFVVASLILIAVALAAGCIPALRASNVDPVVALRRL